MLRVISAGIGRLKAGPERDLVQRYHERAVAIGRTLGVAVERREFDESRAARAEDRKRDEARWLAEAVPTEAFLLALDERGEALTSAALSAIVGRARDEGRSALLVAIGGPDGFDPVFRSKADHVVAFGAMTWPHQLVRVMASEQIYRALTILAGHPYHRA